MRRGSFYIALVVLLVLLIGASSVKADCLPTQTIFKTSSISNAHVEAYNAGGFLSPFEVCFTDFFEEAFQESNEHVCDIGASGTNEIILNITSTSNSHANPITSSPTNICFGHLTCEIKYNPLHLKIINCSDVQGSEEDYNGSMLFSMPSPKNAHVSLGFNYDYDDGYDYMICCAEKASIDSICNYDETCNSDLTPPETYFNCPTDCPKEDLSICEIKEIRWEDSTGKNISLASNRENVFAVVKVTPKCVVEDLEINSLKIMRDILGSSNENTLEKTDLELTTNTKLGWTALVESGLSSEYYITADFSDPDLNTKSSNLRVIECQAGYENEDGFNEFNSCADYTKLTENAEEQCNVCSNIVAATQAITSGSSLLSPHCEWKLNADNSFGCIFSGTEPDTGTVCYLDYNTITSCGSTDASYQLREIAKMLDVDGKIGVYSPDCDTANCGSEGCSKEWPCPRVVKLPFFSWFQIPIALITVLIIYFVHRKLSK